MTTAHPTGERAPVHDSAGARIVGYAQGEARFAVTVAPATSGAGLWVPGTRVRAINGGLVYLAADV